MRQKIDAAEAAYKQLQAQLRDEELAATALQQPLGQLLERYKLHGESGDRARRNLEAFKNNDAEYSRLFDEKLNHPEENAGLHVYGIATQAPGLIHARRHIAETERWLVNHAAIAAELELQNAASLNDGRKHLGYLLPTTLAHLAAA